MFGQRLVTVLSCAGIPAPDIPDAPSDGDGSLLLPPVMMMSLYIAGGETREMRAFGKSSTTPLLTSTKRCGGAKEGLK
jgi:hypothetical protein